MQLEDKENASPQLPPTPETNLPVKVAKPLAANPAASPGGQGAKNRFGYTPSPPGGDTKAHMQQAMPKPQPAKAAEAAPSAKTLIKELASGAARGGNGGNAPTAKQLLVELQEQGTDTPTADDHAVGGGGGFGAFTVSWTPVKATKKPVLAARKPAEKKAAPAAKAAAREPAVPARRSLEKVGVPGKAKPVKDTTGSAVEKKAVGIKAASNKVVVGGWWGGGMLLPCVRSFVFVHANSRELIQTADKKAVDTKKVVPPTAGGRTARASLAGPKVTADKAKKAPVNKRKTLANPVPDKWADDETTINDQDGSKMSVHERLQQIRTEHCCSLGEARRILWKVCSELVAPARACIRGSLTMWAQPLSRVL